MAAVKADSEVSRKIKLQKSISKWSKEISHEKTAKDKFIHTGDNFVEDDAIKSNKESKNYSQTEESLSQSTEGSQDANYSEKWKLKLTEDPLRMPHPATEEWAAIVRQDMADEYQWKLEQGKILGKEKWKTEEKENKNLQDNRKGNNYR